MEGVDDWAVYLFSLFLVFRCNIAPTCEVKGELGEMLTNRTYINCFRRRIVAIVTLADCGIRILKDTLFIYRKFLNQSVTMSGVRVQRPEEIRPCPPLYVHFDSNNTTQSAEFVKMHLLKKEYSFWYPMERCLMDGVSSGVNPRMPYDVFVMELSGKYETKFIPRIVNNNNIDVLKPFSILVANHDGSGSQVIFNKEVLQSQRMWQMRLTFENHEELKRMLHDVLNDNEFIGREHNVPQPL